MDSLRRVLFEDPFTVYLVLVFVEIALVGAWYAQRRRVWLGRMLVPVALAGGAFLLERAVVTDREQIRRALEETAAAAERRDFAAFASHLDEKYRGCGGRKPEAVALAEASVLKYKIRQVKIAGDPQIDVAGDSRADATVRTIVCYAAGAGGAGRYALGWRLELVKRPDGWKIRRGEMRDSPMP